MAVCVVYWLTLCTAASDGCSGWVQWPQLCLCWSTELLDRATLLLSTRTDEHDDVTQPMLTRVKRPRQIKEAAASGANESRGEIDHTTFNCNF